MNQLIAPLNFAQPSIPIYHYDATDRIIIDDKLNTTIHEQTTEGSVFKGEDGLLHRYTHEQIYLMVVMGRVRRLRGYHSDNGTKISLAFGGLNLLDFGQARATKALYLQDVIEEYIRFETVGRKHPVLQNEGFKQRKVSLGKECLKHLLPILKRVVSERWSAKNGGAEVSYTLVGPRHFRRLYNIYVDSGCNPLALVSLKTGPRSRSCFERDDVELWWQYAHMYCDKKRPSMRQCQLALEAEVWRRNEVRESGRHWHMPSRKTFETMIKSLGVYHLTAKRYGEEFARKKFAIVMSGSALTRLGQRVEMDEWLVDLSILLTHMRVWDTLTQEQRNALEKVRVWITVAIDCASKCILAMHFSHRKPSHKSSMAALEMAVTDKTLISALVGTGDPWNYTLVPEAVYTDAGPGFIHWRFRAAVAALHCEHVIPPSGHPAARGTVESFFHTCELRFMHYFEGRTFSNIIEKGKNSPKASLNLDEFNRLFVRAIVDVYHNTPHSGLGFETPKAAWQRLSQRSGINQPINSDERRVIFGTEVERTITDKGVVFMGIHYNSTEMQRARFEHQALPNSAHPKATLRFGRLCISAIGYNHKGKWIDIPSSIGIPKNTTVFEWVGAKALHMKEKGETAEPGLSTMLAGVRELKESGAAAAAQVGLGAEVITATDYESIEKRYFKKPINDDTLARTVEASILKVPRNPLEVGIEAFDHLIGTDDPEDDDQMQVVTVQHASPSGSAFEGMSPGIDDGIFYEEGE
ncbi:hypothetical protein ASC97_31930 [Rhizobium sp. Root1203]|uniref:DDE-type integrase/transposase/recombinase n=1 Tax=Rhizobium sp. Root1203 TaxID=1736427 RepID=UPI00070BB451|nr:DDE-type integrase/transposase/recombinase [Rhizobium sp. Root1203]KQV13719.1 hypothetical protein ASC97_31930 [Rhizobium sp. Root1203]